MEIYGIKIYGSPWVPLPDFKVNWAFGLQRGEVKTFQLLITFSEFLQNFQPIAIFCINISTVFPHIVSSLE